MYYNQYEVLSIYKYVSQTGSRQMKRTVRAISFNSRKEDYIIRKFRQFLAFSIKRKILKHTLSLSEVSLVQLVCMLEKKEEQSLSWLVPQCGPYPEPVNATDDKWASPIHWGWLGGASPR